MILKNRNDALESINRALISENQTLNNQNKNTSASFANQNAVFNQGQLDRIAEMDGRLDEARDILQNLSRRE